MSGLVIKLGPKERVLINGAVLENGDRRGRVNILTPGAKILRLKDAMHPNEANSPVRRVCYVLQLILSGDADDIRGKQQVLRGVEQLSHVLLDSDSRGIFDVTTKLVLNNQFYPALKSLRSLIAREDRLMASSLQ